MYAFAAFHAGVTPDRSGSARGGNDSVYCKHNVFLSALLPLFIPVVSRRVSSPVLTTLAVRLQINRLHSLTNPIF